MKKITRRTNWCCMTGMFLLLFIAGTATTVLGDETKWIAVGSLRDWYSSVGCEIEVGRTHLVPDQQDGLQWNAQFRWQDTKAAKALWIGTTNYDDPISGQNYSYKVVHIGPRVFDETNEILPVEFKLYGRYARPLVFVDDIPASKLEYLDFVDEVDPDLKVDRMLNNIVNTAIGITFTRKINALSQQNHDNYFIYDYVFKNTGIIDLKGTQVTKTLTGVYFMFQYRYAPTKEVSAYGYYYLPQSVSWGHSSMNDAVFTDPQTGNPFRALFTWLGRHSKSTYDIIGGPWGASGDGRLGAPQFDGNLTIHADKSATDKSDDITQPATTTSINSGAPITGAGASQFNAARMTEEYAAMIAGRPAITQAQGVGDGYADIYSGISSGGFSQAAAYGPYTLAPGDSVHIVIAEAVAGLDRASCFRIGANWKDGTNLTLPDGSPTSNKDEYKNAWVMTGKDSLFQTFRRATNTYNSNFDVPMPPPPPEQFSVSPGGDRIMLSWASNAETWQHFAGYRIYRAIYRSDSTYQMIFSCGAGTDNPAVVNQFQDTTPQRGFDYYYYITAFDDGTTNDIHPGTPLESSKFYTMTNEPANLKRPAILEMDSIRVVPNPYNIRSARDLQFGDSAPDRIMFLNIPPVCTIRIYTERGDLIDTIEHTNTTGDEAWDSNTFSRQVVVSGIYIAVFTTPEGKQAIRKFIIIR